MTDNAAPLARNNRGPRSRKGKAAVALAQLDHGLACNEIVLPSEDAAAWQRFHDDVLARLEPEGVVEQALASRVAETLWRLRRIPRAEQQAVDVAQVHRNTIAMVRPQPSADGDGEPRDPTADHDDPEALVRRGRATSAKLGFYGDVILASIAASQRREALPVLLPDDSTIDQLIRYEAHLNRILKHTLHELEALQDRRNGAAAPLARLDIN